MPELYHLSNGMKVIRLHVPDSHIVHCALMINCGGRDEPDNKSGLAHFIEHTFFKGTVKRTSKQILNALEEHGGELNAYTTKEETCIHASVMKQHFNKAADLIADIFLNATFPEKEIEKEKKVIVDEIHAYEDNPYEQIYDDFESLIFNNHPLGNPILGIEKEINSFRQKDIKAFIRNKYAFENMVWIVAGNISEEEVRKSADFFSSQKRNGSLKRNAPRIKKNITSVKRKPISQFHMITGRKGYAFTDERRYTLSLLNNILGGPGMNSRLNMNIREKYGYTYTIESGYHAFSDTGMFHIYFATDANYFEKTKQLVFLEFAKLANENMRTKQLEKHKQQLCGQLFMAQEHKLNIMLGMARAALITGKVPSLDEIIDRIQGINVTMFKEVAEEMLNPPSMSTLIYEPE